MHHKVLKKLAKLEPSTPLINHGLAALLWIAMIALELWTLATISPLISMLCFAFFAHRMRPGAVAGWVTVFSFTSLYFLLLPIGKGVPADVTTAYIRFGTIFIGGIVAVLLSDDRIRIAESFLQTTNILEKLPVPVIVSDCHGCIVFMNNDALRLMNTTSDAVRGASYFSFVTGAEKGKTVQRYFEFVDSKEPMLYDVMLQLQKPVPRQTHATLVAIDGKNAKLLATVLLPNSETAETAP